LVHVVGADGDVRLRPTWLTWLTMAAERLGAADCVADVLRGDVGRILVERSETARLVVLGSFGRGATGGLLTGTLGLALLEWLSCPVAVVRGPDANLPPPRSGPVVAGVDGAGAGRAALLFAAELAGATGARLQAVHAWTEPTPSPSGAPHRPTEATDREADAAAVLDAELRLLRELRPAQAVVGELAAETALQALLDRAAEARAVVVGHRRGTPHSELQLGSTARALTAFAPCPVVVLGPRCLAAAAEQGDPASASSPHDR
jgi:nucleotide-binding universal stress UspA family protein